MSGPHRQPTVAQLDGSPKRRFYTGSDLRRSETIGDLRARTHKRMPRFVLEYLEAGAEEEQTLDRERAAFGEWRFMPRTLVDTSHRSLERPILGRTAPMPLVVAPTGLNGLFTHRADVKVAEGAARAGVPFTQSTMSTDPMTEVAKIPGLRHWWQLYIFGGDEVWQELIRRADAAGCEALVLTTNSQIFGEREWDDRTRAARARPSIPTIIDAAMHAPWFAETIATHGMPSFANVVDFVPKGSRGFFDSAFWIRDQMPRSLSWDTVAKIRDRWKKPFILKGVLNLEDVRRARDAGLDGVSVDSHGGRQMDWAISPLDMLEAARRITDGKMTLFTSGGIRRGTDMLKALALGADVVMTGRATLYGLCAGGADGVARALDILQTEATNDLGQAGAASIEDLKNGILVRTDRLPLPAQDGAP